MEAMFSPPSLLEAEEEKDVPTNLQLNNGEHTIQFTNKFKYLGSLIKPCLTENTEIEAWIKKAKSQLGMLTHFFGYEDVKLHVKYWIYIAGPLNSPGTCQMLTATNFTHFTTLQLGEYLESGWMRFLNAESLTNK